MKQLGLSTPIFLKKPKCTKREQFLQEMEKVVPWQRWVDRIPPHYPVAGRGRRPFPLETMLRIHLMQQWFGYSDPAMEEALHEVPLLRSFAGLDAGEDAMPDETTILKFRRLLERQQLAQVLFDETAAQLAEQRLLLRQGTVVDATLIRAPPSTKNRSHKRDPEMTATKKGNNYPVLPLTNNEAERALRHYLIAHRISHGTRSELGFRVHALLASVTETCRRGAVVLDVLSSVIAAARKGIGLSALPAIQPVTP